MPDKKEVEIPYTTIWISKPVKERIRKIKGRGLSWDRFLNEHFPQEQEENESEKIGP